MKEEWRPVLGYEGMYEVSSLGHVRSLDRVIKRCKCGEPIRRLRGQKLKWIISPEGYVKISMCREGRVSQPLVHRLVLEAFVGPCPPGKEGCHNNGNPGDPRLENLRWDTRKGNHFDKRAHGTLRVGEQTGSVKLNSAQVLEIRASKDGVGALARRYGVGRNTIERVRNRQTWRHL